MPTLTGPDFLPASLVSFCAAKAQGNVRARRMAASQSLLITDTSIALRISHVLKHQSGFLRIANSPFQH